MRHASDTTIKAILGEVNPFIVAHPTVYNMPQYQQAYQIVKEILEAEEYTPAELIGHLSAYAEGRT